MEANQDPYQYKVVLVEYEPSEFVDKEEKIRLINKIVNSKCFSNKEKSKQLLNYLLSVTLAEKEIKEFHIAEAVFGKDENFNPVDDAIVRVNIHKIRRLLEKYYSEEGCEDSYVVSISKRNYQIRFHENALSANCENNKKPNYLIWGLIFSLLINFVLGGFLLIEDGEEKNYVFHDYVESSKPTMLVLADPYFMQTDFKDTTNNMVIRNLRFNKPFDEVGQIQKLFKKKADINPLKYPYFSKNNVWPLTDILPLFEMNNQHVQLESLSNFNPADLKRKNLIVIGNINSFRFLYQFLEKTSISIGINPREIILNDSISYVARGDASEEYVDYAFMVKMPGQNGNIISMIGDFHSSGNKGLAELIKEPGKTRKAFSNILKDTKDFPKYFETIIKVRGYDYSSLEAEVIYFKAL